MNTRGLTEIVILTTGLQLGIVNVRVYSLMVVMALVTTAMAGPVLNVIYPARFVRRDIAEANRAALGEQAVYRVLARDRPGRSSLHTIRVGPARGGQPRSRGQVISTWPEHWPHGTS